MESTTRDRPNAAQLLRKPYKSTATGKVREYLLHLPAGYGDDKYRQWPVMLFLHGGGERGDGVDDLDYVLVHGPLHEAWIRHRDLPFIIIGPQLPLFDQEFQIQMRAGLPKPARGAQGPPPPQTEDRPPTPMARAADPTPSLKGATAEFGEYGIPGGWHLCEEDLLAMVDEVLGEYRADPDRVYLTGLSYGGYGSFTLAAAHPDRWAAVAPICGDANASIAGKLAAAQLPLWIFQGGKDPVVKAHWVYDVANDLERAGHRSVRLTVHEDLGHDVWTRIYAGRDLYDWLISHSRGT
jgi:predicted peptidase